MSLGRVLLIACAAALVACGPAAAGPGRDALRVCADPDNMPLSNRAGEGFENALAELVADRLGLPLAYEWQAQDRGFLGATLERGLCDVVMGVPRLDRIATTRPYYRSGYVFVTRADRDLDLASIEDPRLRDLTIGVLLAGDDGAGTPPAHALGAQGLVDNVRGYVADPAAPRALIAAVARGDVDAAALWGPLAGYDAAQSPVPLRIAPITDTAGYLPLVFQYSIAMGTRRTDADLRDALDAVIVENRDAIAALLADYGVPTL